MAGIPPEIYFSDASGDEVLGAVGGHPPPSYSQSLRDNIATLADAALGTSSNMQNQNGNIRTTPQQRGRVSETNEVMLEFANAHAQLCSDIQHMSRQERQHLEVLFHGRIDQAQQTINRHIQETIGVIDRHNQDLALQQRNQLLSFSRDVEKSQTDLLNQTQGFQQQTLNEINRKFDSIVQIMQDGQREMCETIRQLQSSVSGSLESLAETVTSLTNSLGNSHNKIMTQLRSVPMTSEKSKVGNSTPKRELDLEAYEKALRKHERSHDKRKKGGYRYTDDNDREGSCSSGNDSSESDSPTSDQDNSDTSMYQHEGRAARKKTSKYRKFPTYNGDVKWSTWFNQFTETASGLSRSDKLKELKAHMRGEAADFVFDELPEHVRGNYNLLKEELRNRFSKIESN